MELACRHTRLQLAVTKLSKPARCSQYALHPKITSTGHCKIDPQASASSSGTCCFCATSLPSHNLFHRCTVLAVGTQRL